MVLLWGALTVGIAYVFREVCLGPAFILFVGWFASPFFVLWMIRGARAHAEEDEDEEEEEEEKEASD